MRKCLKEAFLGWESGNGLFPFIEDVADMPWEESDFVDIESIDIDYFAGHSGAKLCSPLVSNLLGQEDDLSDAARTTIAKIIVSKYLPNWNALWRTNVVVYNPIHNYDMVENRTKKGANSQGEVSNSTTADTGTDTLTHGKTETITHGKTDDTLESRYGFNSGESNPKPTDAVRSEEGGTTVTENEGDDVRTKNLSTTINSTNNTVGATEEEEEIHKSGNVGVMTTQQMIESERRVWVWNFFEQVFKDLDKELALSIHDPCRA